MVIVFVEGAVGVVETTEERERTIKVVDRFDICVVFWKFFRTYLVADFKNNCLK